MEKRPATMHASDAMAKGTGKQIAQQPILSSKEKAKGTVETKDTVEARAGEEEKDTEAKEAKEKDGEKARDREKAKAVLIHYSSWISGREKGLRHQATGVGTVNQIFVGTREWPTHSGSCVSQVPIDANSCG